MHSRGAMSPMDSSQWTQNTTQLRADALALQGGSSFRTAILALGLVNIISALILAGNIIYIAQIMNRRSALTTLKYVDSQYRQQAAR